MPKSIEVALALIDSDDRRLHASAFTSLQTAKQQNTQRLSRLQSVPGIGTLVRRGLLDEMHAITRFPRVQAFVSSGRLVQWAKASAGQRAGTSGAKMGKASLTWAFSAAAVLLLRHHPTGQTYLARLENQHGKGQA